MYFVPKLYFIFRLCLALEGFKIFFRMNTVWKKSIHLSPLDNMVSVSRLLRDPLGYGLAGASRVGARGLPWATVVAVSVCCTDYVLPNDRNHIHLRKQMCDIREKAKQEPTCAHTNTSLCVLQPHVKRQQAKINETIC